MADKVFVARNGLVANGSFTANSTVVNAAAVTATSVNAATVSVNGVTVNSMITGNAATAYTNAISYADLKSDLAYANSVARSSNADNLSSGTVPNARLSSAIVNTSGTFTISGPLTIANNITFSNTITAAGSVGTAGQVLTSAGAGANVYWSSAASGANVNASYVWNNTHVFSNTVNVNNSTFSVGSSTVNTQISLGTITISNGAAVAIINSTFYNATANNATYLNGQLASFYQTANNITFGTLPIGRLGTSGTPSSSTYLRGDYSWSTITDTYTGTVTQVSTGTGLTGGPITTSGTISLATAGAGAASYSSGISAITVDAYGRVTSVTGSAGYAPGTVTQVSTGTGLTGGPITTSGTLSLATAGAGAASYSSGISAITVDAYGRVTSVTGSASYATQSYVTSQGYITSSALSSYVAKSGDTMTGTLTMSGAGLRVSQSGAGTPTDTPGYGNSAKGGAWQYNTEGGTLYLSKSQFAPLRLNNNTSGDNLVDFFASGSAVAAIVLNGTSGVNYNTTSDYRLKEDLQPVGNAIDSVMKTPVYNFRWKNAPDERMIGFLAHDAQAVVPNAVSGTKDGEQMQQLDYGKMVPMLWAAVQELTAKVKELEAQLNSK